MKSLFRVLLAFAAVLAIDLTSKTWAEATLTYMEPVAVAGNFFRLTLGYNSGVAFGMLANSGLLPVLVTGVVIVGLAVWGITALMRGQLPRQAAWSLGLILGGAVGNFVDRLPDGLVTDFLDFGLGGLRWPTFNLADTFLILGVGLLALLMGMQPEPAEEGDERGSLSSTLYKTFEQCIRPTRGRYPLCRTNRPLFECRLHTLTFKKSARV